MTKTTTTATTTGTASPTTQQQQQQHDCTDNQTPVTPANDKKQKEPGQLKKEGKGNQKRQKIKQ